MSARCCGRAHQSPATLVRSCCPGRLVRESRAIGKQQAQADALLWSMLEAAAHRERRQIAGNGRVQIKDAVLHGQQHRHRREVLRGGLDAEHRAGVYGHAALA